MLHPIVLKFKTPTNSRVLVMLRIAGPRGGTKKRDRILVPQSDRAVQIHGGRGGWRYFAMYASRVARATWVDFSMLASSMQVESQRDDSDRLELAQLDRAVLWRDVQLVEFSEICDFEGFAAFCLL